MSRPAPRHIGWTTARVKRGALRFDLVGPSSKEWRKRFQAVLTLLGSAHREWGRVRLVKSRIEVDEPCRGTEPELGHFLESAVFQANAGTGRNGGEQRDQAEPTDDRAESAEREMTERFRSFATSDT